MRGFTRRSAVVGLLLLAGCRESFDEVQVADAQTDLIVSCEVQTRSSLDGKQVRWSAHDRIGVFAGSAENVPFQNRSESNASTATFTGTLPATAAQCVAYYPYGEQTRFADHTLYLNLPAEQPFASNTSFGEGMNPAIAQGNIRENLQFKNLCGVIKVQLSGDAEVASIRFESSDRAVSGQASVVVSDAPELKISDAAAGRAVTLTGIAQRLTSSPQSYFLVLPPGTYAGFTIVVQDTQGRQTEKSSVKSLTIKRSVITTLAPFEVNEPVVVPRRDTLWVRGINPPPERWEYINTSYYNIQYMPAYKNCTWFDVDKQYQTRLPENIIPGFHYSPADYNMCWAATTSNLLHYFLEYYHDLLIRIPNYPNREWRYWLVRDLNGDSNGHISEILEEFKKYYRDAGNMTSVGYLDFLCGFGKTPGYMNHIFGADEIDVLMSVKPYPSLQTLSTEVRRIIATDGTFSFSVQVPGGGHAITGWGAVFSESGMVERIYVTNSDDQAGLRSLDVVERDGKTFFEVSKAGGFWAINNLQLFESPEALIRSKIAKARR